MRDALLASLVASTLAGCLDRELPPFEPPRDADTATPFLDEGLLPGVYVHDARGVAWPLEAAPRRPTVLVVPELGIAVPPDAVLLLTGSADASLLLDLERPPLLAANEARRVPALASAADDGTVRLVPEVALAPGEPYVVAVGAWVGLTTPLAVPLRVAPDGAGAVVVESWPADGTAGVPTALPLLALRLDDRVEGVEGVTLRTAVDALEAVAVSELPCPSVGWSDGHCLALTPTAPLYPDTDYRIAVDDRLRDHTGARVGPWEASFRTAPASASTPLDLVELACALDEQAAASGCVLADDASLSIRLRVTGPARAFLETPLGGASTVAPRGEVALRLTGLPADASVPSVARLIDLAGVETRLPLELSTTPPLLTLGITEVRADPAGPEPRQEYVEVLNYGDAAIDLEGCSVADRPDHGGDVIGAGYVLPPGARALVVSDAFDPVDPEDVPVPPGVVLVRIGTSIASSGLSNAGEPLFLRDALGRRLSAAPAAPSAGSGVCFVRASSDPRDGSPGTFVPEATRGCTPGSADRVPH